MCHVSKRTPCRCFDQWLVSWRLLSVTTTRGIPAQTQVPGTENPGTPGVKQDFTDNCQILNS